MLESGILDVRLVLKLGLHVATGTEWIKAADCL
jgi:hypothetical protein